MSLIKIQNLEEQLDKIRKFLPEYLAEQGYDITHHRKILCINPNHNDTSPSMSAFESAKGHLILKCFSCNFVGDIFNACHILEHKPILGPGFIDDTVMYLAKKYDVELQIQKMSDEEIYEMNMFQLYKAAAEYISKVPFNQAQLDELQKRGWEESAVRKLGIGAVTDLEAMREYLKELGYSAKFLDETDFNNDKVFNPNNVIFTIHDDYGRPVGFTARNLKYDGIKDDSGRLVNGPKFINTKINGMKCNIYNKNERLYLFHVAKQKHGAPLYIFEGNGDAITAHLHGIENAVAICGVGLNEHHFNLCRRHGIYDVIICLDGDGPGLDKAKKILDEVLKKVHDLRIRFVFLPDKVVDVNGEPTTVKIDPDEFIRNHGSTAFLTLPRIDPFNWRLQQFDSDEDADPEAICLSMVPIIASEPSSIRREGMIRELSEFTGVSDKAIREEIDRVLNADEQKVSRAKDAIVDEVLNSLKTKSESIETILTGALDKLHNVQKEHKGGLLETNVRLNNLLAIKQYQESEDMHTIFNFGEYFRTMNTALSGDLRQKMLILGGIANTGKTSKLINLSWNLVQNNKDAMCVFLTIDDSAKEFLPRLICYDICTRICNTNRNLFSMININKVGSPYLYKDYIEYDAIMEERDISFKRVFAAAQEDRFVLLDSEDGRSLDFILTLVKSYADKYPDRHLFFFLDNFHLVSVPGYEDGRAKYKHLSHELKAAAVRNNCTIISTAEYRKVPPERKPNNSDLAESVALEYDSNAIIHMDSELHRSRDTTYAYHYAADGTKYPLIEALFGKNKINSFKASIYYKSFPDKAFFQEISEAEFRDICMRNKAADGYDDEEDERG